MVAAAQKSFQFIDADGAPVSNVQSVDLILAAPQIQTPMYKELAKISTDWIMPGLSTIQKNSVALLQMSQKYIEAFMLGANYEMARELLWRGYPTDQRGTCFSHFWGYSDGLYAVSPSEEALKYARDIWPINQWRSWSPSISNPTQEPPTTGSLSSLGSNSVRLRFKPNLDILILTIRGDLLEKYPGTLIYMQEAEWTNPSTHTPPRHVKTNGNKIFPIFSAKLDPDIYFIAFDVSLTDAKGTTANGSNPGYFFVFEENATEVRFGADTEDQGTTSASIPNWNSLSWKNIVNNSLYSNSAGTAKFISVGSVNAINISPNNSTTNPDSIKWAENSASMAYALLQLPVRLAIHADDFLYGL